MNSEDIYLKYKENRIDRNTAINLLISLIDNNTDERSRITSIRNLDKIGVSDQEIYDLLENLVISDKNKGIRDAAAIALKNNFRDNANAILSLLWSIQTNMEELVFLDKTVEAVFELLKYLKSKKDIRTANILYKGLNQILHREYAKKISEMVEAKANNNEEWSIEELAEILEKYIFYIYTKTILK